MSIDSAIAYMTRMRDDAEFRRKVNECDDPAANWAYLRENGFDFSVDEFKLAQKQVYEVHGTDQLPYAE
ncbi:Nif11-like leader peptide family natural product precursor [Fundidesulfovibrio terrae]|uniref:Nif11-like leader peptide family natural product precursor n=1 Tax=Fundidesulfovibrio terrae TaxID=2922866 RepID=UPI001FAF2F54|nr:Nif11-like leader peptide family natural product precursor [Fundidesulfovibrio terrae]